VSKTGKILNRFAAGTLIAAAAVFTFSALAWITDRPEPEIHEVPPALPVTALPPTTLDGILKPLPPFPPRR
jgi:hypothetical protein